MKQDLLYRERRRDLAEAARNIVIRHQSLGDCHFCGYHKTKLASTALTARGWHMVLICDLCACLLMGGIFGDLTRRFEDECPDCVI